MNPGPNSGKTLFVHGISRTGTKNWALENSGNVIPAYYQRLKSYWNPSLKLHLVHTSDDGARKLGYHFEGDVGVIASGVHPGMDGAKALYACWVGGYSFPVENTQECTNSKGTTVLLGYISGGSKTTTSSKLLVRCLQPNSPWSRMGRLKGYCAGFSEERDLGYVF